MPLKKDQSYNWGQILAELGAEDSPPPFALHKAGPVIGFALNRWQNPKAPTEILVGMGPEREQMSGMSKGFTRRRDR